MIPLTDYVLILENPTTSTTAGGLHIPNSAALGHTRRGKILERGPKVEGIGIIQGRTAIYLATRAIPDGEHRLVREVDVIAVED